MLRRLFGKDDERSADEQKLEASLEKTRGGILGRIGSIFQENEITEALWEELEEVLIMGDAGMAATMEIVAATRRKVETQGLKASSDAYLALKQVMVEMLQPDAPSELEQSRILTVVLIVGVNGSGKTTSIGKMAHYYKQKGRKVVVAAADTFRAAAIDQLRVWSERADVDIIAQAPGSDPGAVDLLLVDTAGRLQTKFNLMKELEKIKSIAGKQVHRAPHEVLLVLDATTGQNAVSQAKSFREVAGVTGIILTKLDGSSRGGAVLSIKHELGVPVRFVGLGEQLEDFAEFDAVAYVEGLLES